MLTNLAAPLAAPVAALPTLAPNLPWQLSDEPQLEAASHSRNVQSYAAVIHEEAQYYAEDAQSVFTS